LLSKNSNGHAGFRKLRVREIADLKKVCFYNTFEISVPVWNWLFPFLVENNIQPTAIITTGKYRKSKKSKLGNYIDGIFVPRIFSSSKLLNHLFYVILTPVKILFKRSDLNIFYTQPPLILPFFAFLSRLRKTPYVIHIMDYHPDLLVSSKKISRDSFVYKTFDKLYVRALKRATKVVVLGRCMTKLIRRKGVPLESINAITNFSSLESKEFSQRLNVPNRKLRLVYAGNMGIAHEFRTILSLISDFQNDIDFIFVGKGTRKSELQEFKSATPLQNFKILEYLEEDEFVNLLESSDIHFISLRESFEGIMVPSKFYTSLCLGANILYEGPKDSEIAQTLESLEIEFVENNDRVKMKEMLSQYLTGDRPHLKDKIRTYYKDNASSAVFCQKYLKLINGILHG